MCSSGILEEFLARSPPSERRRDAGKAARALASAEVREMRTKPVVSGPGLLSPVDAIELMLTRLAQECRIGLLICLARESRALQSFPSVIRSAGRAYVILHNLCFRNAKNTLFVAYRDRLSHKVQQCISGGSTLVLLKTKTFSM